MKRAIVIVLDGVGIGELPDADEYGDTGSNTLVNIAVNVGGLSLPNLAVMGLGNITDIKGVPRIERPIASYGKMAEASAGKDSTSGHWELMGLITEVPFPTYPNGFPEDVISRFEDAVGRKVIGNKPASGTVIIEELGGEHMSTGKPIVYTSADSVFQVAAHKSIIPLDELYRMCEIAREILRGEHAVGRVIARPFEGELGNLKRTYERRDYPLEPHGDTILDILKRGGMDTIGVGKVDYLVGAKPFTEVHHTVGNADGLDQALERIKSGFNGLMLFNLIDFDMLWGHRNNALDFAKGLEYFDKRLPEILSIMTDTDLLIITADHGNDPTTPSTDHSREYIPLIAWQKTLLIGRDLGTRESFCDIAATIAQFFGVDGTGKGRSFLLPEDTE
jgi:phosphopentomutase